MPEKIDIIIDSSTDVEAGNEIVSASTDNNIDIEVLEPDYNVTINKREYVITSDNLYIPKTYDESPQWLKDIIGTITDFSLNQKLTEIGALSSSLYGLIDELEVAKNTYTNSIITSAEIDERINTRIETLNSSIAESDATIVDMVSAKATPTEASSLALNVLTASINDGAISSLVSNLQNAISTTNSTLSNNIDIVHAEMTGEFNANAEVIDSMQAYVGIDEAGASTGTGVSAYLEGSNGVIGSADSKVANNVYVDVNGNSRSKFEYNSTVSVGGTNYNSGFGLSNSAGTGVGSEFWINADKLKFTNTNKTGTNVPFSIDASGVTPQIYFNGRVQFSNVDGYTPPDVSGSISANNDTFAQKLGYLNYASMVAAATSGQTIIVGGHVNTNLISAGAINAGMINTAGLVAEDISTITLAGKIINGARINGAVIKASYLDLDGDLEVLTNYHLCTSATQLSAVIASGGTGRLVLPSDQLANGGDAVYIVADDEWRIPSISTVKETSNSTLTSTAGTVVNGTIYSYNTTNIGTNNKAVKRSPVFTNTGSFTLVNAYAASVHSGVVNYINSNHFRIKLGSTILFECRMWWESNAGQWDGNLQLVRVQYSGAFFTTITHTHNAYYTGGPGAASATDTVNIGIGSLQLTWSYNTEAYTTPTTVVGVLQPGNAQYPINWDEGCLQLETITMYQGYDPFASPTNDNSKLTFSTSSGLYINNMI